MQLGASARQLTAQAAVAGGQVGRKPACAQGMARGKLAGKIIPGANLDCDVAQVRQPGVLGERLKLLAYLPGQGVALALIAQAGAGAKPVVPDGRLAVIPGLVLLLFGRVLKQIVAQVPGHLGPARLHGVPAVLGHIFAFPHTALAGGIQINGAILAGGLKAAQIRRGVGKKLADKLVKHIATRQVGELVGLVKAQHGTDKWAVSDAVIVRASAERQVILLHGQRRRLDAAHSPLSFVCGA